MNGHIENEMNDYRYTVGESTDIKHLSVIDRGGFGEVHKVNL